MIAGFQKGKEAREQERAGKREVDFFFFFFLVVGCRLFSCSI